MHIYIYFTAIHFPQFFWAIQFNKTNSIGNSVWQFSLAVQFGSSVWQFSLAVQFGN
jgi:hypothetical protein